MFAMIFASFHKKVKVQGRLIVQWGFYDAVNIKISWNFHLIWFLALIQVLKNSNLENQKNRLQPEILNLNLNKTVQNKPDTIHLLFIKKRITLKT